MEQHTRKHQFTSTSNSLCLENNIIPSVSSIKDLGITISNNLKWDEYYRCELNSIMINYVFEAFFCMAVNSGFHR